MSIDINTPASPMIYTDMNGLNALKHKSSTNPGGAVKEVAQQFESLFMSMMLKSMRDTLPEDSMFGSSAMSTYQDMFDQQLAMDLSRRGGLGMAELIERQLGMLDAMQPEA